MEANRKHNPALGLELIQRLNILDFARGPRLHLGKRPEPPYVGRVTNNKEALSHDQLQQS